MEVDRVDEPIHAARPLSIRLIPSLFCLLSPQATIANSLTLSLSAACAAGAAASSAPSSSQRALSMASPSVSARTAASAMFPRAAPQRCGSCGPPPGGVSVMLLVERLVRGQERRTNGPREDEAKEREKSKRTREKKNKTTNETPNKFFFFLTKITLSLSLSSNHGAAGTATAAAAAATASLCAALGVYCASLLVLREVSALRWPSGTSNSSAGTTETERSCLVTLKTTMPSVRAKRVSSVPRPTSVPGWNCWVSVCFGGDGGGEEMKKEEGEQERNKRSKKRKEKKERNERSNSKQRALRIVSPKTLSR